MNTTQLECFVSLAKTLNYNETAKELNFTQPAISKQIQSLEKELGVSLFNRTTRNVKLSPSGEAFISEAEEILKLFNNVKKSINKISINQNFQLRIGYLDSIITKKVSGAIKELQTQFQEVIPTFVKDDTDNNLKKLQDGYLDLVIGIKDAKFDSPNIIFEKLETDHFRCLCPSNHSLAKIGKKNGYITSEDIYPYRQIASMPKYLIRGNFSRGRNIIPVNDDLTNIYCEDSSEVYSLLEGGVGFTLIPEHQLIKLPGIINYEWKQSPSADFGIYRNVNTSKVTRNFIAYLKKIDFKS